MSAQSSQDFLSTALKTKIVPNQEFLLQGSVLDSAKDVLIHRLRGLCDSTDEVLETFHDLERVMSMGPIQGQSLTLYIRKALDHNNTPWMLRYIGQPELGDQNRPTMLRSSIDVACTPNLLEFLTDLGFKQDYEYIAKGFIFRKGRMKVLLYKVFKNLGQLKSGESWEPVSASHLVELSVLAPQGHDQVANDVRHFADHLKPLVQMEKMDYRRL